MVLTAEQKEICDKRLEEHQHEDYSVDIKLNPSFSLKGFKVMKNVFRPETTSGLYFAKYLSNHPKHYSGKKVLDLGCGSGIQGITCLMNGASEVTFSDISLLASNNTAANVKEQKLLDRTTILCGNLFEKIVEKFDVIVFNHPFFDATPNPDKPITKCWFDDGRLLNKFLEEAPNYLLEGGIIIMPFFKFAGETNNPEIHGPRKNYQVDLLYKENENDQNLQKGEFCVFSLKKNI